ncbi:uncharacterized protein LOC144078982 [Stigmatopora argus]
MAADLRRPHQVRLGSLLGLLRRALCGSALLPVPLALPGDPTVPRALQDPFGLFFLLLMMMMMMMMMMMRRRGRCQTLFLHFKQDKARSSSIPRLVAHVDRHAWSRLRHFLRYDLVLSSDSPSLDGSAQLSMVATDEVAIVTIMSLPLTRAPVEQVHEDYLGDFVTLLQRIVLF